MSEKNSTVQQKLSDLSELVAWFQSSDFALEEAVEQYKKAEALAAEIEADLAHVKNDIKVIKQRFDQEV